MRNRVRVEWVQGFLFAMGLLLMAGDRCVAEEKLIAEFSFGDPQMPILLPVQIQDETFHFVLDTSSSGSVYSSARQWPEIPFKYAIARTGAGNRKVAMYPRPSSSLGPIKLADDDLVATLDFTEPSKAIGRPVHGVLGLDVLHLYVVQLDFESQMVRFFESVPMESGTCLPFSTANDGTALLAFLAANSSFEAILSTGSVREVQVRKSRWDDLQKLGHLSQIKVAQVTTAGGKIICNQGTLDSIRFEQYSLENVEVIDSPGDERVGLKFLSRFHVTLDFPGKAVYLKPNRYFAKSRPRDASGIGLTMLNHQIVVSSVREQSPAGKNGICKGDVILKIDDRKSEDWLLVDLRDALSVPGKSMPMMIQRGGQELQISVELADY